MANKVFANTREIACKAAKGKTICAFPDVCFTPPDKVPPTPPGVPIPYPNTGFASDTAKGSKNVKISKKEIVLKNQSYFKKSTGDEAGCAAKKGVITGKTTGKVYFQSWSMNIKVEGKNVTRHLDMTTNNHASQPGDTPPWPYTDTQAYIDSNGKVCEDEKKKADDKCKDAKPRTKKNSAGKKVPDGMDCTKECKTAKACVLKPKKEDKKFCCHSDTTGHHLIEVHCFSPTGERGGKLEDLENYDQHQAPCVCASQSRADGTHGVLHAVQSQMEGAYNSLRKDNPLCEWLDAGKKIKGSDSRENAMSCWTYKEARNSGVMAHKQAFPHCNAECIKEQLDDYHKKQCGLDENEPLRSDPGAASRSSGTLSASQKQAVKDTIRNIKGIGQSSTGL